MTFGAQANVPIQLRLLRVKLLFMMIFGHLSLFLIMKIHVQVCLPWSKYTGTDKDPQLKFPKKRELSFIRKSCSTARV